MKKIVITGGPGVGKTTVIENLQVRGYAILPEQARKVIEVEIQKENGVLPWTNLEQFQKKVFEQQNKAENTLHARMPNSVVFLDRSLIDGYAYCVLGGVVFPENDENTLRKRYDEVFVLDPLSHYVRDASRFESRKEGLRIHGEIIKAYEMFGYVPISVPVLDPHERVSFILKHIGT